MTPRARSLVAFLGLTTAALLTAPSVASAAEICVDARNTAGGDGSRLSPFTSIQEAVYAAAAGDVLKIAGTQYAEAVEVETPNLTLEGGYAGATGDVYGAGSGGDFDTRDASAYPTIVEGSSGLPVFAFFGTGTTRIASMTIRGGERGVYAEGFPAEAHTLTVEGCILEDNGNPGVEGGGMWTIMPAVVRSSVVRNNLGDRGAGLVSEASILVEGCLVENNVGHGDHGGGIYAAGDVRVYDSVIRGNRAGESAGYGWGGGILVFNAGSVADFRGNLVTGNYAPTHGSGEFIDDGAVATIRNELIVDNVCGSGSGSGLYVDGLDESTGSRADLVNVTIAGHDCTGTGDAMLVERASTVTVTSSIVWGNGGVSFDVAGDSSLTVRYSDVEDGAAGEGNLQVDPMFGDPAAGDWHLRSVVGRPDASGSCVVDGATSPCVDAGDPAGDFSGEPAPNGGRVDMGAFGNTVLASCDPSAATVATTGATGAVAATTTGPGASSGAGGNPGAGGTDGDDDDDDGGSVFPAGGDGDGGGSGDPAEGDGGGCGCMVVGETRQPAAPALGLFLGAAFCLGRRARRGARPSRPS